ncbi:male-cone protein 1-like [Canna indica]|uniref:Male-cone protein 1-like n=1 Tax=Canna indica TaxID=4628 RepID=A0AAQ3KPR0_9LILI|nr:male-cone protein 1-like [Canna indica]
MAQKKLSFFLFTLLVAFAFLVASPSANAQKCGASFADLISQCREFVKKSGPKVDPSKECCGVVKKLDIPCVCDNLPDGIDLIVSLEKAVYVAQKCGKTVKKGTKCGGNFEFIIKD